MAFVPPGNQSLPSSLTQYASRLLDCYVRFGEELWGRSCEARLFSAHPAPLLTLVEQTRRLSAR